MFPSVFWTYSCHTSQELGLMGTKSLPGFFRALLLWQWCFPSFSPLSHKHTSPFPNQQWRQGWEGEPHRLSASTDCYFGFHWPLVGQLCFSPGCILQGIWLLYICLCEFWKILGKNFCHSKALYLFEVFEIISDNYKTEAVYMWGKISVCCL